MKQKDALQVKKLNKEFREYTERYNLIVDDDGYITLWDSSLEEMVFKTIELLYVKGFIEGFMLGRGTKN
jgi:hypothetical protein